MAWLRLPSKILLLSWNTFAAMAPYLLLGFLVAGVLSVFVGVRFVRRHLGGAGLASILKATVLGIPLPLCSCGVIPVAASLRRDGAGAGAVAAFLLSTPQTGVDSILVTGSFMGWLFAGFRVAGAFVSGLFGGALVEVFGGEGDARSHGSCEGACCMAGGERSSRLHRVLHHAFRTLPADLARAVIIGALVAGAVSALLPPGSLSSVFGSGLGAKLLMLAAGIPVYVCATGSVPVAAALMAKGVSAGTAFVFLASGPATNAATIGVLWRMLGARSTVAYLFAVAVAALGLGVVMDWLLPDLAAFTPLSVLERGMPWWYHLAGVALLVVFVTSGLHRRGKEGADDTAERWDAVFAVEGMRCDHCARRVCAIARESAGVGDAKVDLGKRKLYVRGVVDREGLKDALARAGYGVEFREEHHGEG